VELSQPTRRRLGRPALVEGVAAPRPSGRFEGEQAAGSAPSHGIADPGS